MRSPILSHHRISLKFLLLAQGRLMLPRFGPTMEWDTAAGEAILRGAGGHIHTPDGQPHHYGKPGWKNGAFIAYAGYRLTAFPLAQIGTS